MPLSIESEAPPLRVDESGAIRVGNTRVLLVLVVRAFQNGATPEDIIQMYETLSLADAYGAVAYYLRHREAVEAYLEEYDRQAEEIRKQIEERQGDPGGLRARLIAEKAKRPVTTDDIETLVYLTNGGETPIERIALVGPLVRVYLSGLGWLPTAIEDDRMAVRCKGLLRRMGREYHSTDQIPLPNT